MNSTERPTELPELSTGSKKIANSLVALSSAAVVAVFTAGYLRTRAAAERFETPPPQRRAAAPAVVVAPADVAEPSPQTEISPSRSSDVRRAGPSVPAAQDRPEGPTLAESAAPASGTASPDLRSPSADVPNAPAPAPVDGSTMSALGGQAARLASPVPPAIEHLVEPPSAPAAPAPPKYRDGTYLGWGTCRHGDIQAAVVIESGRIVSTTIAQCWTRYSCSWISPLPPQVVARQSAETDYVSGATQSTYAFYYAVLEALSKAK